MAFKIIFLEEFGKAFVPKKFAPDLRKYLLKAGFDEVPYKIFGLLFYFSTLITLLLFIIFVYPFLKNLSLFQIYIYSFVSWFAVQIFFVTLSILFVYFLLDLKIFFRTQQMEDHLPDFLEVVSANLKGGMTFERALWGAIKPRFGILGSEMARASKKVMTGYDISSSLKELADTYDSLMLHRTFDLMITELESGGNVSKLIDKIVDNLKEIKSLKDEMSASSIAYVIFISVIVIVISPMLFALSFHLLLSLLGFIKKLSLATQNVSSLPFNFSSANVDPKDFKIFSIVAISIISLFSSMIVSIVEKGDIKGGVKYIPIYTISSIALYFLFIKILGIFFVGIT